MRTVQLPAERIEHLPGPWAPGPPVPQTDVCITLDQSGIFAAPHGWAASGTIDEIDTSAGFLLFRGGWPGHEEVELLAATPAFNIYRWRHALAVYDLRRDRHSWVMNLADESLGDGFKLDRWDRIGPVRTLTDGEFEIDIQRPYGTFVTTVLSVPSSTTEEP